MRISKSGENSGPTNMHHRLTSRGAVQRQPTLPTYRQWNLLKRSHLDPLPSREIARTCQGQHEKGGGYRRRPSKK
jgi:hypothetical protein